MKTFGLIGKSLKHSFSKHYFESKFQALQIEDCEYRLFELEQIEEFERLNQESKLSGLNVTIPYKKEIIPFLDDLSSTAREIQAVNTIEFQRSENEVKFIGHNTDVIGFRDSLRPFLAKEHHRALVFGNGGASKAVQFVLKQLEIPFYIVSRKPAQENEISYADLDAKSTASFQILVNTTPVGTFPNIEESLPIDLSEIGTNHLAYDLIYNPEETVFLKHAKAKGALCINGLSMLKLQAEAAWKIWNS